MDPLRADDPRTIGEFQLHARLGAGGMGRVYLGFSPAGRAVAVKLVHPQLAKDAAFLGRFRREVAAAQAVNGAYTTPVVAAGPDDSPPWLATAFVPGPSLQEFVMNTGPLPEDAVARLGAGLAEALRVIHDAGLVHRDLKPGNVLLAPDGPRVIDFGIARALDGTVLTSAEQVLGTPQFMSPEQAQGKPAGPASDVFSLACVLHFAATGANPFGSGHPAALLYRIVHDEPDLAGLPSSLRYVVTACLAKEPVQRPGLGEVGAILGSSAEPPAPPGQSPPSFWPDSVVRLIREYQARLDPGLPPPQTRPLTQPAARSAGRQPTPVMPHSAGQAARPRAVPGMARRRALAALAGAVTGGLAVGGWELLHRHKPHAAAGGQLIVKRRPLPPSGTKLWTFKLTSSVQAVTAADGVVYAGNFQDTVAALDAFTGKLLWQRTTLTAENDQLAIAGGTTVVAADASNGGLTALDIATGRRAWTLPPGGSGVLGLAADASRVYTGAAVKSSTTGGVTAFGARSGDLLWTYEFGAVAAVNAGLAVVGNAVYGTSSNGDAFALDAATGSKLWRVTDHKAAYKWSPQGAVVAGNTLYAVSDAAIYALDVATGRRLWRTPADQLSGLAVTAGMVFGGNDATGVLAFNGATGQHEWSGRVAGGTFLLTPGPDGVLYSGSNSGVLDAWHAATGRHLWSFPTTGEAIACNVAVADGVVFFGSNDHHVYAVAA